MIYLILPAHRRIQKSVRYTNIVYDSIAALHYYLLILYAKEDTTQNVELRIVKRLRKNKLLLIIRFCVAQKYYTATQE